MINPYRVYNVREKGLIDNRKLMETYRKDLTSRPRFFIWSMT